MNHSEYDPGLADAAHIEIDGERWTLVVTRFLRHPPEKVWPAITEPEHLHEWAPFDVDASLGNAGALVRIANAGAPQAPACETRIVRADAPHALEYRWGDFDMRWELTGVEGGTRLTLWTNIDRRFIAMGAAGWHVCLDVLDHLLSGDPIGRLIGADAIRFGGWQRLHREYAAQFGVATPGW